MSSIRNSLTFRLALPFALLLVVTIAGITWYTARALQNIYLDLLQQNLVSEAGLLADTFDTVELADTDVLNQTAQEMGERLSARVTVIDAQGNVRADTYTPAEELENHADRPEFQRALQGQPASELRYSDTFQTNMLYAAAPVIIDGETQGAARLAVSLNTIQREESGLFRTIFAITIATILLAVLATVLVARFTTMPIQALTSAAQQIARGEDVPLQKTNRQDEIGRLYHAVQDMAGQLHGQIDALHTERTTLEIVLANMSDGILIVDTNGIIQLINPAALRIFNVTEDDAYGKSMVEVLRNHRLVALWRESLQLANQQSTTVELPPDRLFVQAIASPLHQSLPGMTLLLVQDLTHLRKLETVRRDFVSNVSHELRTPLASLKALTETLQEGALEDPPAARRFLQRMETEIDNLTQMVHELLELSKIESNRVPLHRKAIEPCEMITPAIERLQLQAERAGLTLQLDCPDPLPKVYADPVRIEQVLVNIIHNAVKFTPPGGVISVSARAERDQVVFSIRDTGVGIDEQVLPRIFERFYKTDRSRSGGGTGLGLSIARHLIETHGGKIWAESAVNQGSTFFFTLPLSQE